MGFPQRGSGQRLQSKPTSKGGSPAGGLRGFKFIQDVRRRTTKRWRKKSSSLFRRNHSTSSKLFNNDQSEFTCVADI